MSMLILTVSGMDIPLGTFNSARGLYGFDSSSSSSSAAAAAAADESASS